MKFLPTILSFFLLAGCNNAVDRQAAAEMKARSFLAQYSPGVVYDIRCAYGVSVSSWWKPCNAVTRNPYRVVSLLCNMEDSNFCFVAGGLQ